MVSINFSFSGMWWYVCLLQVEWVNIFIKLLKTIFYYMPSICFKCENEGSSNCLIKQIFRYSRYMVRQISPKRPYRTERRNRNNLCFIVVISFHYFTFYGVIVTDKMAMIINFHHHVNVHWSYHHHLHHGFYQNLYNHPSPYFGNKDFAIIFITLVFVFVVIIIIIII